MEKKSVWRVLYNHIGMFNVCLDAEHFKSLLSSVHRLITDLICKLQQKFDYIFFFCRASYANVWYSFDVTCIGKFFYLFFVHFQKGLISLQNLQYRRRCPSLYTTSITCSVLMIYVWYSGPWGGFNYENNYWNTVPHVPACFL